MSDFPRIKEWRSSEGAITHVLLVDQFGYVIHAAEVGRSPFAGGGSTRLSYAEFLSGRDHSHIRAKLGDDVLNEALALAAHNALLLSGQPLRPNNSFKPKPLRGSA